LVAVHVRDSRVAGSPSEAVSDEERLVLGESLSGLAEAYPDVVVQPELTRGKPAEVLVECSRSAQLVVTGARGRGGFAALLLGSVSHTLMHHADCPVAVVRAARTAAS
jgi:nucleotide-binding universal stress UspA family protein